MGQIKHHKVVSALPGPVELDSVYYVRSGSGFDLYATNSAGLPVSYTLNGVLQSGSVNGQVATWNGTAWVAASLPPAGDISTKTNIDSPAFTGTVTGISKVMVGLGNVDNTSDSAKPISSATQTALGSKENSLPTGTTAQYFRGNKTLATLNASAVGLGNVNNTADSAKPVSTAQATALALKVDKAYNPTSNSTTNAVVKPNSTIFNINPTAPSSGIFFSLFGQTVWTTSQNLINGGHTCGVFGQTALNSTATLGMALGVEGRIDTLAAGTITQAKSIIGILVNQSGTMTNAKGMSSELSNGTGRTITNGYGYYADIAANGGTITKYVGYAMPATLNTGITTKYFFENLDTAAPSITKAPIVQQDYGYSMPTTGTTVVFPNNYSDFSIVPSGTLATLTLTLPSSPIDGQNITFSTTQAITAITLNTPIGTIMNAPTALTAGQTIEFKWYGQGINLWVRKR